jgi:hypothetical protein
MAIDSRHVVVRPAADHRAAPEHARRRPRNALCLCQRRMSQLRIRPALILSGVVLLSTLTVDASKRMHMQVSPLVGMAPVDLHVYVGVERRADNRILRVSAESTEFYRSSEVQLDGEDGPRVSEFSFRGLPAGSYEVRAELVIADGSTADVERCNVVLA